MNITNKLILLFVFISLVPIAIISFFSYITAREAITKQALKQLEFIAAIEKGRINAVVEQNLERLNTVTSAITIPNHDLLAMQTGSASGALKELLNRAKMSHGSFKDILLLDQTGQIVASTNDRMLNHDARNEEYFIKGKTSNTLANFSLDQNNQVSIYLAGPIRSGDMLLGVVVAVESDVDTIRSLIRDYSGLGETGELLLAKWDENGDAIFIAPSRFHANAALRRKISKQNTADPMIRALSRVEEVITDGTDYRGKHVLAVTKYIDSVDWGLVVKMDQDEAFGSIRQLGNYFLYTAGITVLLAILNAAYFARTITRPVLQLVQAANAVRNGDLWYKIGIKSKDEVGQLATAFGDMTKQLRQLYTHLEQKVSEKTLQLAKKVEERDQELAKDQALLASIGDGVIATDEQELIILVNASALEMLRFSETELIGKRFEDVVQMEEKGVPVPATQRSPIAASLLLRRKIMTSSSGEMSFVGKDGTKFPVGVTVTPVILSGKVIGTILVFRDMTVAREIDRMKTEFISLASHQLRTPLSAIRWFSEMLLDRDIGEMTMPQREIVENISAANARMIDLVNSLLNISRIESGKIVTDLKPTALSPILEEIAKELQVKLSKKSIRLTLDIPRDLPLVTVDKKLIREAYLNLLNNAITYTPQEGKITVKLLLKSNAVLSQITDTGYGIPEKEQHRVFQKFYRGENIISKATEGTGLGLYLVKEVLAACGGAVWFSSREGEGTTFWISLPIVQTSDEKKTTVH